MRGFIILAALPVLALGCSGNPTRMSEFPEVAYAFGDLVLDPAKGLEQSAGRRSAIRDCSTATLHCVDGDVFRIAIPKDCSDLSARSWSVGSVRTEVVATETEPLTPHRSGSGERLLLGDPSRPSILYEYDRELGVISVYFDEENRTEFVTMARSGELDRYRRETMTRRPFPNYRHGLLGRTAYGRCT